MELDGQVGLFADNPEYDAFVEKFKRKKTTDDCFTPPLVYDAVRDWACAEYGIDPARIVRPFWPDTDYRRFDYPAGCVVLDNPPFSILTPICEFYLARNIPFFLFAPALTCMGGPKRDDENDARLLLLCNRLRKRRVRKHGIYHKPRRRRYRDEFAEFAPSRGKCRRRDRAAVQFASAEIRLPRQCSYGVYAQQDGAI